MESVVIRSLRSNVEYVFRVVVVVEVNGRDYLGEGVEAQFMMATASKHANL